MPYYNFSRAGLPGGAQTFGAYVPNPFVVTGSAVVTQNSNDTGTYDSTGVYNSAGAQVLKYVLYVIGDQMIVQMTGLPTSTELDLFFHYALDTDRGEGYQEKVSVNSRVIDSLFYTPANKEIKHKTQARTNADGTMNLQFDATGAGTLGSFVFLRAFGYEISNVKTNILIEGDSRVEGNTGVGLATVADADTFPSKFAALISANSQRYNTEILTDLSFTKNVRNIGKGGATTTTVIADESKEVDSYFDEYLQNNIYILSVGVNDFSQGGWTANNVYTAIKGIYDSKVAEGWTAYVCTIIQSGHTDTSQAIKDGIDAVNVLLRANIPANRLIDHAADSRLSSPANATYFQADKLHLTPAGNQVMADLTAAKITDFTAPTVTSFSAAATSATQINLALSAADNVGVTGIDLQFRASGASNWTALLSNAAPVSTFQHTGRTPGTAYEYQFRGRDAGGNVSPWSYANATTATPSAPVFTISGQATLYIGQTGTYTTDIPNPIWSSSSVAPNANTISNTGVLSGNKAETTVLQAREELWTYVANANSVKQSNNDLLYATSTSFDPAYANIYLKQNGDFVEFELPQISDPTNSSFAIHGALYDWVQIYFTGGITRQETGALLGSFTPVVGKKVKILRTSIGVDVYYDGNYVCSNNIQPTAGWDSNANGGYFKITLYNQSVPVLIKKPTFLSSTVPEKIATKSVTVATAPDTTEPTITTFAPTAVSPTQINIAYAATDASGIGGYDLEFSLAGANLQAASGTNGWTNLLNNSLAASPFQHTGRTPSTQYFYRLRVRDTASNVSPWSAANATTLGVPPVASFSLAANLSINVGVLPNNTTSGMVSSFAWFVKPLVGGSFVQFSPLATPEINISAVGDYIIKLVATNAYGSTEATHNVNVTDPNYVPPLSQTYTPNTGLEAPETITFTDTTTGTLTETYWNFGDYITSTEENPTHTYLAPGKYKVYRNAKVGGRFSETEFQITIGGGAPDTGLIIFDEAEISRNYLAEPVGGPTFLTTVFGNPLANQQRDISRLEAVHRFKISFADDPESYLEFLNVFMTRKGQGYGFRFYPPFDSLWDDEEIAKTGTSTSVYRLVRTYTFAGRKHVRRILKPCPDLIVKINGNPASDYSAYTIDYTTGIITFAVPSALPANGSLTVTGEYCIPVYFATDDYMPTAYPSYNDIQGIEVVEILPVAFGVE